MSQIGWFFCGPTKLVAVLESWQAFVSGSDNLANKFLNAYRRLNCKFLAIVRSSTVLPHRSEMMLSRQISFRQYSSRQYALRQYTLKAGSVTIF